MQLDVESAFYLCSAPMKIYDPPTSGDALAQADCSSDVTFLIYEPDDVQPNAAELLDQADGLLVLLVGDNWIINCSSEEAACEQIQGGTGGDSQSAHPEFTARAPAKETQHTDLNLRVSCGSHRRVCRV